MQTVQKRVDFTVEIPDFGTPMSIGDLKRMADRCGSHYFEPGTMRFFKSRTLETVIAVNDGWLFLTSEQGPHGPRKYTVRKVRVVDGQFDITCAEGHSDGFMRYSTGAQARAAAKRIANAQHVKPLHGLCNICGHYGSDCTGQ